MSKLLGTGPLTIQSNSPFQAREKPDSFGDTRRQYVCRRCQVTFAGYQGMPKTNRGIGVCPEHRPRPKCEEQAMGGQECPVGNCCRPGLCARPDV